VSQLLAPPGVTKPRSRPHVSDNQPFLKSQLTTLKYQSDFADRFVRHDHGHDFCRVFLHYQNEEHGNWGIHLLTLAVASGGQASAALEAGTPVLAAAHDRPRAVRARRSTAADAGSESLDQRSREIANRWHI